MAWLLPSMCLPDFCLLLAKPSWEPADLGRGTPQRSAPRHSAKQGREGAGLRVAGQGMHALGLLCVMSKPEVHASAVLSH